MSGIFLFRKFKATFTSTVVTLDLEKNLCTDEMKELVEQGINHFTPRLKSTVSLVKEKRIRKNKNIEKAKKYLQTVTHPDNQNECRLHSNETPHAE